MPRGRRPANESFTLYRRESAGGQVYYARFYDEHRRVIARRSTGHTAKDRAWKWAQAEAERIRAGAGTRNPELIPFLREFWSTESKRTRNRSASGKPLSEGYIEGMARAVRLHVKPWKGFHKLHLDDVTPSVLTDFKLYLAEIKTPRRTANLALKAVTIAIRWAQRNGECASRYDFAEVGELAHEPAERGILEPAEVAKIVSLDWADKRQKAAILLGLYAGLRRGEVRGLRWGKVDFEAGTIYIDQAINREGEAKAPKQRSKRTVPLVPQTEGILRELHDEYPYGVPTDDDFVLCATPWRSDSGRKKPHDIDEYRSRPIAEITIRRGWFDILDVIGIDEAARTRRNLTFHGTRHYFAKNITGKLPILVAQRLMGHRTQAMTEHYAGHESAEDIEAARKIIGMWGDGGASG